MTPSPVRIHYRRPPDRVKIHEQWLVLDEPEVKVSLATDLTLEGPMVVDRRVVLEDGSDVVWFTFPDAWHDIGRFHDAAGRFTGVYANVLTPVELRPGNEWHTTDLFLDVWIPVGGEPTVLDRDELDEAVERGWIDEPTADRAVEEAETLLAWARQGTWPPEVVEAWTLERAREALGRA